MTDQVQDVGAAVRQLLGDSLGFLYSACLRVAVRLNIADHLADGPKNAAELAGLTGVSAGHLHRVLRYLATRSVFQEEPDGTFRLTPVATILCSSHPASVRSVVLLLTDDMYWLPAGRLEETVRNGNIVFKEIFGAPIFDYLATNPEAAACFNTGLADLTTIEQGGILANYQFPQNVLLVDIGGGAGGLLKTVLRDNPTARGVLFEMSSVLDQHVLDDPAIAGRWQVVEGDFFTHAPAGGDVYLLKRILHDWDDANCLRILKAIRAAMSPAARLLVIDAVIPTGNDPHPGKTSDIAMMTNMDGKERTEREFDELLAAADFKILRLIPTPGTLSILECAPA